LGDLPDSARGLQCLEVEEEGEESELREEGRRRERGQVRGEGEAERGRGGLAEGGGPRRNQRGCLQEGVCHAQ
jgi:hypothetical protein